MKGADTLVKRILFIPLLVLILSTSSVIPIHNKVLAESKTATVLGSSVNIRTGPGLSYSVKASAKNGETFEVIGLKGDWVNIKLKNGSNGWIAGWLVSQKAITSSNESIGEVTSTATGLRIRTGPGTSFQIIDYFPNGEKATAISQQGDWVKISYKGKTGWVYSKYITFTSKTGSTETKKGTTATKTGIVLASTLNVREQPTTKSSIVGKLYKNENITIVSQQGDWYQIKYEQKKAWVHGDFVQTSENNTKPSTKQPFEKTGVVTASSLNVRNQGSLNGKIIGQVNKGTIVTFLNEVNNWYQIQLSQNQTGWVAGWYVNIQENVPSNSAQTVTLLYNGTNLRNGPSTSYQVISRGNKGDQFDVIGKEGKWYKIKLANGKEAYVAGWIVTTGDSQIDKTNEKSHPLQNNKIIIDPGHGGYDSGAIGVHGTLEKNITLKTAKLVYNKLKAMGADATLTRSDDTYISLNSRVYVSNRSKADAFISIHYDSSVYSSARGITTYYYNSSKDKKLASTIHQELTRKTSLRDRGIKFGNFHVLRENFQPAALLELGFLSNPTEEWTVTTNAFQEQASQAIYNGLVKYFQ